MHDVLVVADDLTGSADTGHAFARRGFETAVLLSNDVQTKASIVSITTESRYAPAATAAEAVRSVIRMRPASTVYKKIDSTLRGNLVAEIDATIEASNASMAVVAPAFPATGRTTVGGTHLVHGTLVTDTEPGRDPRRGPETPHIPTLLSTSNYQVSSIDVETVARGPDAILDAFESIAAETIDSARNEPTSHDIDRSSGQYSDGSVSEGRSPTVTNGVETTNRSASEVSDGTAAGAIVVCDATHEAHLAAIATAIERADRSIVAVGCGGLAEHVHVDGHTHGSVPDPVGNRDFATDHSSDDVDRSIERRSTDTVTSHDNPDDGDRSHRNGGVLAVIGSIAQETLDGFDEIPSAWLCQVDAVDVIHDDESGVDRTGSVVRDTLARTGVAVLTAATSRSDVNRTIEAATAADVDRETLAATITETLATVAEDVVQTTPLQGLFLTGGETAIAVLESLEVGEIRLHGAAVEDGIPIGRAMDGRVPGCTVITKAGAFGDDKTVINCLERIGGSYD